MSLVSRKPGTWRFRCSLGLLSSCAMVLGAVCLFPLRTAGQEQKGAGVVMSGEADAKDVGLPLYPGSRRHKDKDEDSTGANLGLWGGGSGFKLVVLKMEADAPADKVAEYYRKALAKYGKVLDCSHASPAGGDSAKGASAEAITCDDDKPEKGGMVFKAGTKEKQHVVAVQANGQGSLYQLIYVASWGNGKK
jgi:hypothetical protein